MLKIIEKNVLEPIDFEFPETIADPSEGFPTQLYTPENVEEKYDTLKWSANQTKDLWAILAFVLPPLTLLMFFFAYLTGFGLTGIIVFCVFAIGSYYTINKYLYHKKRAPLVEEMFLDQQNQANMQSFQRWAKERYNLTLTMEQTETLFDGLTVEILPNQTITLTDDTVETFITDINTGLEIPTTY